MTSALPAASGETAVGADDVGRSPVQRWDERMSRIGDALNPILVKETRQALKSRQFVVTFSLLLLASVGWSVGGSVMLMPQIYYMPSAPTLLVGYYLVLAVPMLLVVPLAAYRSLAAEMDDGTLELLTVTALSPMQVVTGKLASAALQMMLYFVALVPCVAYAYALRGTDMPTVFLLLGMTLLTALQLTVIGIFLAPLATGRTGQLTILVTLLVILVAAEFAVGSAAVTLITEGMPAGSDIVGFFSIAMLVVVLSNCAVLMNATAAQLTPPSENRSTRIRLALFAQQLTSVGLAAYAVLRFEQAAILALPLAVAYVIYWALIGSMMAAESPALTPRIRRDLPLSFSGRMLKTWFMPGPGTGVVFAVANAVAILLLAYIALDYLSERGSLRGPMLRMLDSVVPIFITVTGYLALLLVLVRWFAALLRMRSQFQPPVGMAILVVVALVLSVGPYMIQMHLNDYRGFGYSRWQVTNWVWTLEVMASGGGGFADVPWIVLAIGGMAFLTHLALLRRTVLPQRVATPQRVREELQRLHGDTPRTAAAPVNPLGPD